MTTAPRIHRAEPSHPNVVSRSLRKKCESTFETTTAIAPSGVTRIYKKLTQSSWGEDSEEERRNLRRRRKNRLRGSTVLLLSS